MLRGNSAIVPQIPLCHRVVWRIPWTEEPSRPQSIINDIHREAYSIYAWKLTVNSDVFQRFHYFICSQVSRYCFHFAHNIKLPLKSQIIGIHFTQSVIHSLGVQFFEFLTNIWQLYNQHIQEYFHSCPLRSLPPSPTSWPSVMH